jgi:hypothetical protein
MCMFSISHAFRLSQTLSRKHSSNNRVSAATAAERPLNPSVHARANAVSRFLEKARGRTCVSSTPKPDPIVVLSRCHRLDTSQRR